MSSRRRIQQTVALDNDELLDQLQLQPDGIVVARDGDTSNAQKLYNMGLHGDKANIALLLFLYVLQGIPIGLAASIPMILQNKQISYKQQAKFSFVYWPFSLKLLWAPIIDSCFSNKFGRRKTWLIPTQYMIGIFMFVLSFKVGYLLGEDGDTPAVTTLTVVFFMLNFLAATQDIAVDGWALTMLQRHNVGYASTCNSVGQTAGYFLGYVVFMALESADFCNKYLRSYPQPAGILTVSSFLYFWSIIFFITTTVIMAVKTEKAESKQQMGDLDLGVFDTYLLLWKIVRLPSIKLLIMFLLTCKIGFSATDAVTGLKLVDAGVPKDRLALLAIPLVPLQIILPLFISKYTSGPNPMDVFLKAVPFRLLFGVLFAYLVWITPGFKQGEAEFPVHYYAIILVCYMLHQIALYSMFVSVMAFFARISDPAVGGTYMTMLNTMANLGGNWPSTLALWWVDLLTWKSCIGDDAPLGNKCQSAAQAEACKTSGSHCVTNIDGYYIETAFCVVLGFVWFKWGKSVIRKLQGQDEKVWRVVE